MADRDSSTPPPLPTTLPVIPIAGRGKRLLCAVLDFALVYALTVAILTRFFPDVWSEMLAWHQENMNSLEENATLASDTLSPQAVQTVTMLLTAVIWLYFVFSEAMTKGSSLGKSVFGLRVMSMRGTPPTPLEMGVRASIKALCFLLPPIFLLMNILLLLLHRQRRSAHDFLAQTLVVAGKSPIQPEKKR